MSLTGMYYKRVYCETLQFSDETFIGSRNAQILEAREFISVSFKKILKKTLASKKQPTSSFCHLIFRSVELPNIPVAVRNMLPSSTHPFSRVVIKLLANAQAKSEKKFQMTAY